MFKKEDHYIPVVVLKTKHQLNLKTAAQAIGYYSRAKTINSTGIALLVNESDGYVSFRIVLFPYQKKNFGAQAILLPSTRYSYDNFVASGSVIKLICTICGVLVLDKSKPFTVTLSGGLEVVDAENLIGVYSEQALKELEIEELERKLEEQKEELRKLKEQNEHKKRELESLKKRTEELQKQKELELQGTANKRSKQS